MQIEGVSTQNINSLRNVPLVEDKLRDRYDLGKVLHKAELFTAIKDGPRTTKIASVK